MTANFKCSIDQRVKPSKKLSGSLRFEPWITHANTSTASI